MSSNLRDFLGDGDDKKPKKFVIVSSAALLAVGNEGANKGFWRIQLRDDNGNWIPMGGAVTFEVDLPDIGKVFGTGTYQGKSKDDPNNIVIRVKNHSKIPDGDYSIPPENLEESAEAIIPADDLERITNGVDSLLEQTPELKDEITGDEALKTIRSAIAKDLKEQGRFPVVRSDKDIEDTVSKQYKSLFAQIQKENPELLKLVGSDKKIENEDLFWTVLSSNFATDLMTMYTSPDQLNPLQRLANQLYAEKFLGLKRDGLISFYRNNIRGKDTEADAAAGYASLDKYMAFDYNVALGKDEGGPNTGRYEIKAKPDEINGLLGFSRIGDEIGVVISPEVTSIPGRVTRLGDLEIPDVDSAPWLDLKNIDWDRSFGSSPFRQHRALGQFDYYGLDKDPFGGGADWGSFYEAHGLEKGAIPEKYDELYGEGAWERDFKEFPPMASYFKTFFTEYTDTDGSTKWGLRGDALWNIGMGETDLSNPKPNDGFEKNIKMLSTMQELIGKPFFVSRGHDPNDPRLADVKKPELNVEAPSVEKKEEPESLLDFSKFDKISGPLGSNAGGTYQDPATGKKYYVKIQDKERGANEELASALYEEAGINALKVKKGVINGKDVTYTEWTENLTPVNLSKVSPDDSVMDGFAVDAWLANWDIVGTGYDNLSFDKDGNPVRIDSGGALLYRARGARKGDAFGNEVKELDTFRDTSNTAGELYSKISLPAEKRSVEKLRAITPEKIDQLVDQYISDPNDNKELKEKLKARREYILNQYPNPVKEESSPQLTRIITTQDLSDDNKKVLKDYTAGGFGDLNRYLRYGDEEALKYFEKYNVHIDNLNPAERLEKSKKDLEELNTIFDNNSLTEDATLFRLVPRKIGENVQIGDTISDSAVISTTKNVEKPGDKYSQFSGSVFSSLEGSYIEDGYSSYFADDVGWTVLEIQAPKGSKAIDVSDISGFKDENEVVLPPNTELIVDGIEEIDPSTIERTPSTPDGDFKVYKLKVRIAPKKEKEEDSLKILEECGVDDPKEVLDRLERAKKGEEIEQAKIKVKNVKKKET